MILSFSSCDVFSQLVNLSYEGRVVLSFINVLRIFYSFFVIKVKTFVLIKVAKLSERRKSKTWSYDFYLFYHVEIVRNIPAMSVNIENLNWNRSYMEVHEPNDYQQSQRWFSMLEHTVRYGEEHLNINSERLSKKQMLLNYKDQLNIVVHEVSDCNGVCHQYQRMNTSFPWVSDKT